MFLGFLLALLPTFADIHPPRFEGIFGEPSAEISNRTYNVWMFIPYNPIIVEVGAYEGENAKAAAKSYPDGQVIVFEPNPRSFQRLLENVKGLDNLRAIDLALSDSNGTAKLHINRGVYANDLRLEKFSSLLDSFCFGTDHFNCFKGPTIEVPCSTLDDWCQNNQVDHIDFLHLDTEGCELQILKNSEKILKTVNVIHTKTNLTQFRKGTTQWPELRAFLEERGFTLFSHWYLEGLQGEATFVQTRMYDAIFR